jgi:ribosomal protein S18 acetylase RimI-like enzyme
MIERKRTMEISILESKDGIKFEEINVLTESVGWGKCFHQTEEKWQHILAVSKHIAYIKNDENLIAFGRILEDGIMCMFYDICVHPDYQGKNIGTLLMDHLINKIKDNEYISIGLFTWEGNKTVSEFYNKFGFVKSSAMELKKYMKKF